MRRLIAVLACRIQGSRIYGKPVQNLAKRQENPGSDSGYHRAVGLDRNRGAWHFRGIENEVFVDIAKARKISFILSDQVNVLSRLISCGRQADASNFFLVTTECPFPHADPVEEAWNRHLDHDNDVTAIDGLPEGTHFEIYTLKSLELSHQRGTDRHRSEGCSRYIREHRDEFQVEVMMPPDELARMDLRLTVHYPEDLVLCRRVCEKIQEQAPLIPLAGIIEFLDVSPDLKRFVESYFV